MCGFTLKKSCGGFTRNNVISRIFCFLNFVDFIYTSVKSTVLLLGDVLDMVQLVVIVDRNN